MNTCKKWLSVGLVGLSLVGCGGDSTYEDPTVSTVGETLKNTSPEADSVNCMNGGLKVEEGIDSNLDGTLQKPEIDNVSYLCDVFTASPATFRDSGQRLGTVSSGRLALGDLDGDNDLDAFVISSWTSDKVWFNDGSGNFTDSGQIFPDIRGEDVALGDLDGDGDLDAFTTSNYPSEVRVWLNNGNGMFSDSGQLFTDGSALLSNVELGDFDNDGDLDASIYYYPSSFGQILINNGSATFTDSGQRLAGSSSPMDIDIGDLNGDDYLDLYVSDNGNDDIVFLNDGSASFTTGTKIPSGSAWSANLGDLDGDNDLDVLITRIGDTDTIWFNDGTGNFLDSGQNMGGTTTGGSAIADLDGDGDLDIYSAYYNSNTNKVWLNDGTGEMSNSGQNLGNSQDRYVRLGDLDGDGDLDAFVAVDNGGDQVWFND